VALTRYTLDIEKVINKRSRVDTRLLLFQNIIRSGP
jgi:hypothetical protein